MANPFEAQKRIEGVRNVIAVAAGKGGVGKSTVATNLAVALAKLDLKVGLLDADIYGPSVPQMMGLKTARPNLTADKKIQPLMSCGVRTMSIGYLVDDSAAIIWRGPMLFKAIDQFLHDVLWGELDVLVCDLPPGTGDVQLSLVQKTPLTGAVIVSTPQDVAFHDVQRCVDMFTRTNTPILGLIENMSEFVCPHCSKPTQLFRSGKLHKFCEEKKIPIVANIPFIPAIGATAEEGKPFSYQSAGDPFSEAAVSLRSKLI